MKSPTIRQLAQTERPLVLPGAHDALSALLIKQAGFKGFFIGGFQAAGARYGLPDIGLCQLGEFSAAFRDMINACDLPVLVDADNGYGDVKNCVHLLNSYERMGVQAMFIEDQVSPKRCGHMAGKRIVPTEEMEAKLRAMAANRINPDTFIVARTDARALHGMDEALRRTERYVRAGADGIFIESMLDEEEIARAVREVDTVHVANMLEGGITPILKPSVLGQMGYKIALYGITLLLRVTRAMQMALADLKSGELKLVGSGTPFEEYTKIVGIDRWRGIEEEFGPKSRES
ncbi:MAG: isocitrate lyase/PEP mutase family protein [Betaproteobacteria bacterium]|nr:isocitrate lyase/PEP mutase family protein [Betaproteobacteria bacterium]MDH3436728.1 isocitrate lyase/PEP mutase family protein [Betaproteobacteria bacterium]